MLHTKFQATKPSGSEAEDFSIFFYSSNLGPLATGHLGPWDLHLNKFVRGELGNATYQISNNWPSGSEVEDFLIYFYAFL